MTDKYDDIINLPHHVSANRPHMSMIDRAAQFSPFAALTGYEDAVKETERLTEQKINLNEAEINILNDKLNFLQENLQIKPTVSVTYFMPDNRKNGGSYTTVIGTIKRIDTVEKTVTMTDGCVISIDDILKIESEVFKDFDE
ncbi:MAG: YolD-like family protein [Faecalibacterium sp.]|nr:YolD-like family protein [Ruminococcus sp.]MCM1484612.1 YolD-like family protein [Faecalibacterium sp.]